MRLYLKKTHHKKGSGEVAQGVDPEFKPQCCKKTKKVQEAISHVFTQQLPKSYMCLDVRKQCHVAFGNVFPFEETSANDSCYSPWPLLWHVQACFPSSHSQ
jgi:hypothetical protein